MQTQSSWDQPLEVEPDIYPPEGQAERRVYSTNAVSRWATLCHLSALAALAIPFGHIAGPLVTWLLNRDIHPFVDEQGKEAVNFQISMTLYAILAGISIVLIVGVVLLPAVIVMDVVFLIRAAMATSRGESYRYPMTIRFLS